MLLRRRICSLVLVSSLAACSGAPVLSLPNASGFAPSAAMRALNVTVRILVPRKIRQRQSHFISPSTKALTVAFKGPIEVDETVGLTPHSPGCMPDTNGTACTLRVLLPACPSKNRCYSGSAKTYDKVSCKKGGCTIPAGAHELSADGLVDFGVRRGRKNRIVLSLSGIPKSVGIVPGASSTLIGSASGFGISKCVTAAQDVSVVSFDADGNQIVGEGAPVAPTLTSNDVVHLAVASPGPSALPNEFTLRPPSTLVAGPTIPNAHSVVRLTAGVTPANGAPSTKPVRSPVNVTFDATVCGKISEFPLPSPTSGPSGITTGPDGAMWFTECYGVAVGRIPTNATPGSGAQIKQYPIPNPGYVEGIVSGPDGALWYAYYAAGKIGRMTTTGTATTYSSGMTPGANPWNLAVGRDHAIWFTDNANSSIGRITTGAAPSITEYPTKTATSNPNGIVAASDGNLWFTECNADQVAKFTLGHVITEYGLGIQTNSHSTGIAQGSDGALWFTESNVGKIGRISTAGGMAAAYSTPSNPAAIAAGPDGALWFTEFATGKVGRMNTSGVVTGEYAIPTASSSPEYITTGPDGALWFTEYNSGKVGRLQ